MFSSRDLAQIIKYLFLATLLVVFFFFLFLQRLYPTYPLPGAEWTGTHCGLFLATSCPFLLPQSMVFTYSVQFLIPWPSPCNQSTIRILLRGCHLTFLPWIISSSLLYPKIQVGAIWFPILVGYFNVLDALYLYLRKRDERYMLPMGSRVVRYTLPTSSWGN